jgi:hypothetical protein
MDTSSSSTDLDFEHLHSIFTTITTELSTPFLERRAKSGLHKKDTLDELADVINLLRNTEKELFTAVEIAKMLMEKNLKLKSANQDLETQLESGNEKIRSLQDLIKILRKKNKQLKLQEEDLWSDLKEGEIKMSSLKQDYDALLSKNFKLSYKLAKFHKENDIEQPGKTLEFSQDAENFHEAENARSYENEIRIEALERRCAQYKDSQSTAFKQIKELKLELDSYKIQNEELQDIISSLKNKIADFEQCAALPSRFSLSHIISKSSDTDDESTHSHTKNFSLLTELEELGEASDMNETQEFQLSSTLIHPLLPLHSISSHLQTQTIQNICLKPRISYLNLRKSPAEEYFLLVLST